MIYQNRFAEFTTAPSPEPIEHLITGTALARILGCHPRTVQRLRAAGVLEGIRIGTKLVRYDPDACIQALREWGREFGR